MRERHRRKLVKCVKGLFVAFLAGLFLCGCQATPEEVKENMKEYGDNQQKEASEITYCSKESLKAAKLPEVTGSSFSLPEEVDFSDIEDVEVLHLSIEKNFLTDSNIKKYTTLFGAEREKLEEQDGGESSWGNQLIYDNKAEQNYMHMMKNGGLVRMAGQAYDCGPNVIERKYNLNREDISQVNVILADGEVSLSKLCKNTEQWMEENMHIEGIRYKISDAYVRKAENSSDQERTLSLCAEYEYKGIRFNNHTMPLMVEDKDFNSKVLTTFLSVQLSHDDTGIPSFFSRNMNVAIDSTEPVEKVVDLESAVRIVRDTLSGFGAFHISEVLPLYELKLEDNCEAPGAEIEARPVYAFLVKREHEDSNLGILKIGECAHYFLVDMVTGELTTDLDIERGG